jgi:uncharacterized protein (TIGR03067 family)
VVFVRSNAAELLKGEASVPADERAVLTAFLTEAFVADPPERDGSRDLAAVFDRGLIDSRVERLRRLGLVTTKEPVAVRAVPGKTTPLRLVQPYLDPQPERMAANWGFEVSDRKGGRRIGLTRHYTLDGTPAHGGRAFASVRLDGDRAAVLPWHFNVFGARDLREAFAKAYGGETFVIVRPEQAGPKNPEPADSTAWGDEVGGLQVGLLFKDGKQTYHHGETANLEVKLRNVGTADVKLTHGLLQETPPSITDARGERVFVTMPPRLGIIVIPTERVLKPGEAVTLYAPEVTVERRQIGQTGPAIVRTPTIRVEPGQFKVVLGGMVHSHPKLSTGLVAFEVKDAQPTPVNTDLADLQGDWVVVAMEGDGEKVAADVVKGMRWAINGNEITGTQPGLAGKMSFKLNPGTTPTGIDITPLDGNLKGTTSPGIYAIDGQKLRVCFGEKVRPKAFVTAAGDGHTMLTLEREAVTAWGKEVGGLQLGLVMPPASRVATPGTKLGLEVRVRNVGKTDAAITHSVLREAAPRVTDGGGKRVAVTMPPRFGGYVPPSERVVRAGETISLYRPELTVEAGEPDAGRSVGSPILRVPPGKYEVAYAGVLTSHPVLATGAVGVEVRIPPAAAAPEPFTAWGQEAGGLQAGLEVKGKKTYRLGETVTLTVRVRNVGTEAVKFEYIRQYLDEHPPGVTGADGKVIPQATSGVMGVIHARVEVNLEPGKEVVLGTRIHGTSGVPYDLWPSVGGGPPASQNHPLRVGTGKVTIQYVRVFGNSSIGSVTVDPRIAGLATGKLELEVKEAPPEKQKVLTPEEAVKAAGDSRLAREFNAKQPPVEFKVEFVSKAILVKAAPKEGGSEWEKGHGPGDVALRAKTPADSKQARFLALLTTDAINQLNKAGIQDIERHLRGKTIRVRGAISWCAYDGLGTPPEVEIVVDDLSRLEVVD